MSVLEIRTVLTDEPSAQRRVTPIDLGDLGVWLVNRLQKIHSEATPNAILGWLRGCMTSNGMWFVRTEHAVGMAEIERLPLEVQPIVKMHFLFAQEDFLDEAVSLFPSMAKWAANQNASELRWFDADTDVSRQTIKYRMPSFTTRSQAHIRLGRID